ncbi:MAG TPA: hypothetical protein VES00_13175 [Burkholderiaceae bacterium]|jgi:hypothetical protein|nr:hypothetical protein [Burkholderiaceae bacterium]
MTIDRHATHPAATTSPGELVQFVFRSALSSGLLKTAREMLDAAPRELAESFEQAVRRAGLAS